MKAIPFEVRFHQKYIPEPNTGCWLWTDAPNRKGYGELVVGKKVLRAHRVSWFLHFGEIKEGLHVLHKCDTPACVNPCHLFLGTNSDNMIDKKLKGRATSHESNKTRCPKGHPYDELNTAWYKNKRKCRECHKQQCKAYYQSKK